MGSKLLELPKELFNLKEVSGLQLESFKNEIATFSNRVKKLNSQIETLDMNGQLNNLREFVQTALEGIHKLENKEASLDAWKSKLADHFCEDTSLFKLEDCFNILFKFCEKIKKCLRENQERRCFELRRSSSVRGSRKFLNPASNESVSQKSGNRRISSSHGRFSMGPETVDEMTESLPHFNSSSSNSNQNFADDLDNYADQNELSFFRRSTSVRLSRKSSVKKIIPGLSHFFLQYAKCAKCRT